MKSRWVLGKAMRFVKASIIEELRAQGHVASGDLIDIKIRYNDTTNTYEASLFMEDYADKIDSGNYTTGSFATMYKWAKLKEPSFSNREILKLARGATNRQAPSRGSYSFTKNGRRTEWRKYAIEQKMQETIDLIRLDGIIDALINRFIKGYNGKG